MSGRGKVAAPEGDLGSIPAPKRGAALRREGGPRRAAQTDWHFGAHLVFQDRRNTTGKMLEPDGRLSVGALQRKGLGRKSRVVGAGVVDAL